MKQHDLHLWEAEPENRTFALKYGATEESNGPQRRKHLYQVGREQNPECRLCGREDETPVH